MESETRMQWTLGISSGSSKVPQVIENSLVPEPLFLLCVHPCTHIYHDCNIKITRIFLLCEEFINEFLTKVHIPLILMLFCLPWMKMFQDWRRLRPVRKCRRSNKVNAGSLLCEKVDLVTEIQNDEYLSLSLSLPLISLWISFWYFYFFYSS